LENKNSTNKEFCIYTESSMVRMINLYYVDFSNNTIYFENIEDYARYIGPDWFGVSYCGNNTVVNNIGNYFKVTENKKIDKREDKKDNEKYKESDATDDAYDDDDNLSIYRCRTLEEYKEEYKKLYEKFYKKWYEKSFVN